MVRRLSVVFRNSCSRSIFWYLPVTLKAGTNTVSFGNPAACTPDIDKVTVAPLKG
ncbi:hypothetical protein ACIRG4_18515 [Streptomyces sp. NPDC102395]|uniref:hypothetical protein n=1 Tax=Streptomyces sp. NPDC102395 TaxID=3366168 RepID=UPI0038106D74